MERRSFQITPKSLKFNEIGKSVRYDLVSFSKGKRNEIRIEEEGKKKRE